MHHMFYSVNLNFQLPVYFLLQTRINKKTFYRVHTYLNSSRSNNNINQQIKINAGNEKNAVKYLFTMLQLLEKKLKIMKKKHHFKLEIPFYYFFKIVKKKNHTKV